MSQRPFAFLGNRIPVTSGNGELLSVRYEPAPAQEAIDQLPGRTRARFHRIEILVGLLLFVMGICLGHALA